MAQFSVPSSTVVDFSENGDGVGNTGATSFTGAATAWEAVADDDEADFITLECEEVIFPNTFPSASFTFGMQATDDPLVNTGHTFRIVARGTIVNHSGGGETVEHSLAAVITAVAGIDLNIGNLTPDFTEYVLSLSEAEVIAFRAAGGYAGFTTEVLTQISAVGSVGDPVTASLSIDIAFIQLEVPDAEPPNPNDLIGNVSIDLFDFSEFQPEEIIGDVEIDLFDESLLVDNEIIGDVTIALSDDSIFGESGEIVGDVTIELTVDAVLVMSADASGLYELIPGKTEDTLYQREDDVTTIDVAIPNPTVKTAFVGS